MRPRKKKAVRRRDPDRQVARPDRQVARHGVARWISKLGLMSRAEAERRVAAGRVTLNGRAVRDPDAPCHPERDRITVDGRPARPARKVYLAMHKPAGTIATARDPEGRPTVYDLLPPGAGNVQAVGRLDAATTGLLLFTNDTEFAARVTEGGGRIEKTYEARIQGELRAEDARRFEAGIDLDGQRTRAARLRVLEPGEASTLVEVTLTEGRNRQVRRMWEALGYPVLALHRTWIGPIALGDLKPGQMRRVREIERSEISL